MDSSRSPSPAPAPSRGASDANLRWGILRRALLARSSSSREPEGNYSDRQNKDDSNISRKASRGFNLLECQSLPISHLTNTLGTSVNGYNLECEKDVYVCYKLPGADSSKLNLVSKKVLELGSGYGLVGLVIAASTNADEVVISDGNPQVVEYVQKNISINAETFGETKVKSMVLHWDKEQASEMFNAFDIIVASDCTFFKQFHHGLARVVKAVLKHSVSSQAIFLSPKRGDSLDRFLEIIKENGLCFELVENYDPTVWNLHRKYMAVDNRAWPNYEEEHCYPLLIRIKIFSE